MPAEQDIYDIKEIPSFAFQPSKEAWIALSLLFVTILILAILRFFSKRYFRSKEPINIAIRELEKIKKIWSSSDREQLSLLSSVLRRSLSKITSLNLDSASASDIQIFISQTKSIQIKALLQLLLSLEELRFMPSYDSTTIKTAPELALCNLFDYQKELEKVKRKKR